MNRRFFWGNPPAFLAALISSFILFSSFGIDSQASEVTDIDRNSICAFDFLTFRSGDPNRTFLEVLCQIPTNDLQFIKFRNGFLASYSVNISLHNADGTEVESETFVDSVTVATFGEIALARDPNLLRFAFFLPPGDYNAHIELRDLETLRSVEFDKQLEVPDYRQAALTLSHLQMAVAIEPTDVRSVLVKNKKLILPNIPHFLDAAQNELHIYAEAYNLAFSSEQQSVQEFLANFSIRDLKGDEVKSIMFRIKKPGEASFITASFPVDGLRPGEYELVLTVEDLETAKRATRSSRFLILGPGLDLRAHSRFLSKRDGEVASF